MSAIDHIGPSYSDGETTNETSKIETVTTPDVGGDDGLIAALDALRAETINLAGEYRAKFGEGAVSVEGQQPAVAAALAASAGTHASVSNGDGVNTGDKTVTEGDKVDNKGLTVPSAETVEAAGSQAISGMLFNVLSGDSLKDSLKIASRQMQDTLIFGEDGLIGGMLKDMDEGMGKALKSLGKSIMGGIMGIFGIGGKAVGGPVHGNTPYMVGENGPELFVPTGGGNILTNSHTNSVIQNLGRDGAGAGGGGRVSVNVINNGSDKATTKRRRGGDGGEIIDVVIGEATSNVLRGGAMARAMEARYGLTPQGM